MTISCTAITVRAAVSVAVDWCYYSYYSCQYCLGEGGMEQSWGPRGALGISASGSSLFYGQLQSRKRSPAGVATAHRRRVHTRRNNTKAGRGCALLDVIMTDRFLCSDAVADGFQVRSFLFACIFCVFMFIGSVYSALLSCVSLCLVSGVFQRCVGVHRGAGHLRVREV